MASIINASTSSGLVNSADTSGDLELQSNGSTKLTVSSTGVSGTIVQGTAVASTSGTSIDFTGIPSWAKRITISFAGLSTSGTSSVIVQIGTSGGLVTSSTYLGSGCFNVSAASTTLNTNGFRTEATDAGIGAGSIRHGVSVLTNLTGNTWCFTSNTGFSNSNGTAYGGGSLALGGVLTQLRITTVGGTDTFDAGSINIQYEG